MLKVIPPTKEDLKEASSLAYYHLSVKICEICNSEFDYGQVRFKTCGLCKVMNICDYCKNPYQIYNITQDVLISLKKGSDFKGFCSRACATKGRDPVIYHLTCKNSDCNYEWNATGVSSLCPQCGTRYSKPKHACIKCKEPIASPLSICTNPDCKYNPTVTLIVVVGSATNPFLVMRQFANLVAIIPIVILNTFARSAIQESKHPLAFAQTSIADTTHKKTGHTFAKSAMILLTASDLFARTVDIIPISIRNSNANLVVRKYLVVFQPVKLVDTNLTTI